MKYVFFSLFVVNSYIATSLQLGKLEHLWAIAGLLCFMFFPHLCKDGYCILLQLSTLLL